MSTRSPLFALALALAATTAQGQGALVADLSGRATTQIGLNTPRVQGQPAAKPSIVKIEYGQPAARGRDVPLEFAKVGTIWRTGANASTTLTTDVDLMIGDLAVPKGAYSLYSVHTATGYELIVNKNTGQWGTEYVPAQDLGRLALMAGQRTDVQESLHIALKSSDDRKPNGTLLISWGKLDLSTTWSAK